MRMSQESEFNRWFKRMIEPKKGSGVLDEIAEFCGVRRQAVDRWQNASQPDWHTARLIAEYFNVDRELVRRQIGYVDPDADPYIAEATLTAPEATIVRAYRLGDPDVQEHLHAAARLALRIHKRLDAFAEDAAT